MGKETIIQFYTRYRMYIFPAIVTLSSLFLILFAIYLQAAKLIENQNTLEDYTNQTKFLATKVAALESYNGEDLSQKVGITLNSFPTEKDYGNILGLLQRLAAESGFTISSIVLGNPSSKLGNVSTFEIKLEIKGPRNLFQTFLTNLENSSRIMKVSSIDISSTLASEPLDATLVVDVLYSPAPLSFGTVDSTLPTLSQDDERLLVALAKNVLTASSSSAQSSQRGKVNPFE